MSCCTSAGESDEAAKPTFIDSGQSLDIAPRRGGGLVQWLIRCTESSWCCACCCRLLVLVIVPSSNPLTCSPRLPLVNQESAYLPHRSRQIPPGLLTLPSGEVFVLQIVWTLILHLMIASTVPFCLLRAYKRGGPAPWSFCCFGVVAPLRFNTLGNATTSNTSSI